jgi:hypothetical protein
MAAVDEEVQRVFHGSKACLSRVGPDLQLQDSVCTNFDEYFARKIMAMYAAQADPLLGIMVEAIRTRREGLSSARFPLSAAIACAQAMSGMNGICLRICMED